MWGAAEWGRQRKKPSGNDYVTNYCSFILLSFFALSCHFDELASEKSQAQTFHVPEVKTRRRPVVVVVIMVGNKESKRACRTFAICHWGGFTARSSKIETGREETGVCVCV